MLDIETVGLGGVTIASLALVRFILQKHFEHEKDMHAVISQNTEATHASKTVLVQLNDAINRLTQELRDGRKS